MSYINKPPKNKNGVIPTKHGWIDAKTKELLVSVRINPDLIEQWKNESPSSKLSNDNEQVMPVEIPMTDSTDGDVDNTTIKRVIRKSAVKRKRTV